MRRVPCALGLIGFLSLLLSVSASQAQGVAGARFGASVGAGVNGSPMGEVAERYGLYAIPGMDYEARVVFGSGKHEWSLGGIWNHSQIDHAADITSRSRFDYTSTGLVVGFATVAPTGGVPILYGVDLGWTEFEVSSSVPNYYTQEQESTRTRGHAALLSVTYGVEIPLPTLSVIPRLRLATSYPDFGGGDGYSGLHREAGLGFNVSLGVSVKKLVPLDRK